jgi:ferric-dicitrate binding protein FerR (iron transport regulator)
MTSERLIVLFQQYVDGTCTEGEKLEFLYCVASTSHDKQLKTLMDELWAKLPDDKKLSPRQAQRILNAILATGQRIQQAERPLYARKWIQVAASVLMVAICVWIVYMKTVRHPAMPVALEKNESTTPQYRSVTLPDGSTVQLNYSSELDYPETFEGLATREVYLKGEGFFDIVHDASRPFIVHTGRLNTTVLGTAFNIKAYNEEKSITVTVTRGKVQVGDGKKTLGIITHDQQLTFYKTSNEADRKEVNAAKATDWRSGSIHFDDITIEGAVRQLEERFNVKIVWSTEKLKDCRFTASFIMGESLEEIIQVICEFNQSKYRKDSTGNFTIEGEGC